MAAARASSPSPAPKSASLTVDGSVTLTQQYRDRHGLTCELGCSGRLLTLRFLFPLVDADNWRLDAWFVPGPRSPTEASGMTREQAFLALTEAWNDAAGANAPSRRDWEGVAVALRAVRAL